MKLTIDRMSLLRPLGHVQSVVERRNTIPILANVVLRAEEGELSLTATDMDMDIATEVGCSVMTSGTTTMSAHLLYDIARKLPDGAEVEIAVNDGHAMVSAGRSSFRLPTLPVEDFPAISSNELPVNFSLTAADMRDLIDATRFAISTEETRYYLNGIYIHKAESGELCAVATDGHRLAMTRQALPSGAAQMPSIILPRKAVSELRKLLDDFFGGHGSPRRVLHEGLRTEEHTDDDDRQQTYGSHGTSSTLSQAAANRGDPRTPSPMTKLINSRRPPVSAALNV